MYEKYSTHNYNTFFQTHFHTTTEQAIFLHLAVIPINKFESFRHR